MINWTIVGIDRSLPFDFYHVLLETFDFLSFNAMKRRHSCEVSIRPSQIVKSKACSLDRL